MKKPSFLEITDELEKTEFGPATASADDSFLDMGKASLDMSSTEGEEGTGRRRF